MLRSWRGFQDKQMMQEVYNKAKLLSGKCELRFASIKDENDKYWQMMQVYRNDVRNTSTKYWMSPHMMTPWLSTKM